MHDESGRAYLLGPLDGSREDLAGRDADAIVGRRNIDEVRSMDVDRYGGLSKLGGV
jgi:hypothetical protein